MTHRDTSPLARLQEILHLPPLPGVACRLLKELADDEADIDRLAALIEQDPGLAARIVGIANSAYFARSREVTSVRQAIVRVLGLNMVRGLAIGIALSRPFDASACPDFDVEGYWYQAFQTATLAAALAPHSPLDEAERDCLFLAGLLHNLGRLVLVHAFPGRMGDILRQWQREPDRPLAELESEALAVNETEAGRVIATLWNLPGCVGSVIEFCGQPRLAPTHAALVQLVALCRDLCAALHADPEHEPAGLPDSGPVAGGVPVDRLREAFEARRAADADIRALAALLTRNGDC
ncbi:HDOD domain-containing protein [Thiohalobacter sp.]|uniref:HDOD domain-containing protein n=1 Tax=Thiohalobacter sp. TaxID=2025948 RepID=UPI00260D010D|nr:HDOD domain-containing protein [Thiohalobacter sp.]